MQINLLSGDITKIPTEIIVNAANSSLYGGGGVDGAIHRAAGPQLLQECQQIRENYYPDGLPVAQAVLSRAYELPAKYVIHTVGPVYGKDDPLLLKDCYQNSLLLAEKRMALSISFPAISTGIYHFPVDLSARLVSEVLAKFQPESLNIINLVLFKPSYLQIYRGYFSDSQ